MAVLHGFGAMSQFCVSGVKCVKHLVLRHIFSDGSIFIQKKPELKMFMIVFCAPPLHTTILARCLKHQEHGRPIMKRFHARLVGGLVAACPIFQANSELRRRVLIAPTSVEQT